MAQAPAIRPALPQCSLLDDRSGTQAASQHAGLAPMHCLLQVPGTRRGRASRALELSSSTVPVDQQQPSDALQLLAVAAARLTAVTGGGQGHAGVGTHGGLGSWRARADALLAGCASWTRLATLACARQTGADWVAQPAEEAAACDTAPAQMRHATPQLAALDRRDSTHAPPHTPGRSLGHLQTPLLQVAPVGQALPHAPAPRDGGAVDCAGKAAKPGSC